ncbi:hypothetical protein M8998_14985 [Sphingobacterium sp. lm-10]|uniref:hypothetical protein n=1 Tax=Sphingobacterium sp. lm-10 TaxID=2944904 RepID=UPI0020208531|nr:hypothetical protein [Sphingobacterium sp. lm-10]MCL7989253.1 hypothetical protein [Sphingobacterium sp. lm-10]
MEELQHTRQTSSGNGLRRLSWSAIFAGVLIAIIVQFLLSLLGLGIGLSTFSPTTDDSPFNGYGTGASIWWLLSVLIALFTGGLVTGWLSSSYDKIDNILHGAVTWGLFTLLSLYIITSSIGNIMGGIGTVIGKGASAVGSVVEEAAPEVTSFIGDQIDLDGEDLENLKEEALTMLRQTGKKDLQPENIEKKVDKATDEVGKASSNVAQDPNKIDSEAESLFDKLFDLKEDILSAADQEALANIISERTDKTKEESKELVSNWAEAADNIKQKINEATQQAAEKAEKISEEATDAVGKAAILGFFALLLGAAATIGGAILANNKRAAQYGNRRML